MKKAFDQTVRDLKRGVNKKVLKVPSIEQKVLDSTSNEPWGPHGSLLADIAQATRNYHEYQMIMSVLWKRINDTGKNWRHVYKALTVLEYLVAHGSERVIDDIREHAYQISTLSDFQYIDSSGKDQGNNVRKKSQSLVVLANDKERIQEVRQKAAVNREKYRNAPVGGMYRPGSGASSGGYGDRYDDDRYEGRYGNRDDERNGYGRERDGGSRDDDRYGRYGDAYGREGDRYSRDNEERYGRDGYRDDDYRGRGQSIDEYRYGSRSRSADRDRERANEDDSQYSSRGSGAKADDHSQDGSSTGKGLDRKYSDQNLGAPPSYEEVVGPTRSPTYSERDGESSVAYAPKGSSPTGNSPSNATTAAAPPLAPASPPASASPPAPAAVSPSDPTSAQPTDQHSNIVVDGFDEFDPRGSFIATPTASNGSNAPAAGNVEMDFFGSLSDSLALVPTGLPAMTSEVNASANFNSGPTFAAASSASTTTNQGFDDPFGDGPFKAIPTTDNAPIPQQITNSFNTNSDVPQPVAQNAVATNEFGGNFYDANYMPASGPSGVQPPTNTQFGQQDLSNPSQDVVDILADILPPSAHPSSFVSTSPSGFNMVPPTHSVGFPPQTNQPAQNSFQAQTSCQPAGFPTQLGQASPLQASYPLQSEEPISQTGFVGQTLALTYPVQAPQQMGFNTQNPPNPNFYGNTYHSKSVSTGPAAPNYMGPPGSSGPVSFLSQSGSAASQMGPQARPSNLMAPAPTSSAAIVPQPSKNKFETKSTVWADTLSRGLVDLNISGTKTNPLADIGVDFDAINRREKRMEKPTTAATTVASTVAMGKAMGSGSGIGRAGAGALRPPPNAVMAPPGTGMGMGGGYGGVSQQPMSRGMGMGMNMPGNMGMSNMNMPGNMGMSNMNMPGNMGMGMNMGIGQGMPMQQQPGFPPASTTPGGYNNQMMGSGNYGQHPYGGYR